MKYMKLILTILMFSLLPKLAEAQTATIELEGYAYGAITGIMHDCPIRQNGRIDGYVGMVVTCEIWAIDSTLAFTPASLTASAADPTRVQVTVSATAMDSVGNYIPSTMMIQVLRSGNWKVTLDANPMLFVAGHMFTRPEDSLWPQLDIEGDLKSVVGEQFALCAYEGGSFENAKSKSLNRPNPCPDPPGLILPEFEVVWVLPDFLTRLAEATPNQVMAGIQEGTIYPRWLENTRHSVPLLSVESVQ